MTAVTPAVVIGVGNDYRGDDAVGLVVAREIANLGRPDFEVIEASGEGGRLIDAWDGFEGALLIDAMRSGAAPGTMRRVDVSLHPVPAYFSRRSTHAIGVLDAVEIARAMGRLPRCVVVFGIEGASFDAGHGLSPEVECAIPQAVEAVLGELQAIIEAKEQASA